MQKELPRHIGRNNNSSHQVIVSAFIDNKIKCFTINLIYNKDSGKYDFITKPNVISETNSYPEPFVKGGSGAEHLPAKKSWEPQLLNKIRSYNKGHISAIHVADFLADMNYHVHQNDKYVGSQCIVVWRNRDNGLHKHGSGHQAYIGKGRETNGPGFPEIVDGLDLRAITGVIITEWLEGTKQGKSLKDLNFEKVKEEIEKLPHKPEEKLR